MSKQIWLHLWYSGLLIFCVAIISRVIGFTGELICNAISKASDASNRTAEQLTVKIEQSVSKLTTEIHNVELQRIKFQRFLQYEISGRLGEVQKNFQLLKCVNLGNFNLMVELRKVLSDEGVRINKLMEKILDNMQLNPEEVRVALVTATVAELGFTEGATYRLIANKISQLGFNLCPEEVGPQLRLQYKDQPCGEGIFIATKADDYSNYFLMELSRDKDNLLLRAISAKFFNPEERFVFIKK